MPTAAKLVAALMFALTGYVAAELLRTGGPEGQAYGHLSLVSAGVGFVTGWRVSGLYAGQGYFNALGYGLRSAVQLVVVVLLICGIVMMLERAYDQRYNDVALAFIGIFEAMYELLPQVAFRGDVLTVLVCGGIIGGFVTERAARLWR